MVGSTLFLKLIGYNQAMSISEKKGTQLKKRLLILALCHVHKSSNKYCLESKIWVFSNLLSIRANE